MAIYDNKPPVLYSKAEVRRARRNNNINARKAIEAYAPPATDRRDNGEILSDLLCDLRTWASTNRVNFHEALTRSEHDFLIETGKIAENTIPVYD